MVDIYPNNTEALINALKIIQGGEMLIKAGDELQQAVKSAMLDGKTTTLTIKLEFKKANNEALTIRGMSKLTLPTKRQEAMFFVTDAFLPSRERPKQSIMNFER